MSIDKRTRLYRETRDIPVDEVFDLLLPEALKRNAQLACRGLNYKALSPISIHCGTRAITLAAHGDALELIDAASSEGLHVKLSEEGLSNLVQDRQTTMGLAMTSKVEVTHGKFDEWIGWEPVFRALLDGRPVHEAGAIALRDREGNPLDLTRSFSLDDDREEISQFLSEAGFLHIENIFSAREMEEVARDLDAAIAEATPDDGASWWAGTSTEEQLAVRVLWFDEKSAALRELLYDDRLQWLASLTGDGHTGTKMGAEGLVKPLDIQTGLSDLPWHKDCGQGMHSYYCSSLTVGISVTGADVESGALGVVPGSHRANLQPAGLDPSLDLVPIKLETRTGDLTVHCSDTLHRAHRPTKQPRKVVYSGFRLAALPGDVIPKSPKDEERATRARLTNVRDRIAATGGDAKA